MSAVVISPVARLLEENHDAMARVFAKARKGVATSGVGAPTLMVVVIRCDDRLAQGLLYACGGDGRRFETGDTSGSAVAVLSVDEVVRFLEIADQVTMALMLRSRPPRNRFWALGISAENVMLESQALEAFSFAG
jgi:hypothetical protein